MKELKTILIEEKERIIEICREFEPPFCTAACPFRLDVNRFTEKLCLENFTAAYRIYQEATGFPAIAASLCKGPCREVCMRKELGGSIRMDLLERAAIANAGNREPRIYNLPEKNSRVAIVGGGVSGLACGMRLAEKKYKVTVFEARDRIGGQIFNHMPEQEFLDEVRLQMRGRSWELRLNERIAGLSQLAGFDAVYVATGNGGDTFGLSPEELTNCFCSRRPGVFMGGSLLTEEPAEAMAHGLRAALYIESYIKTGNMQFSDERADSRIPRETFAGRPPLPETAAGPGGYTPGEAKREAERCFRCRCEACSQSCHMMRYFRKKPGRISDDASATAGDDGIRGEIKVATRLIASCNQCGLCKEQCCESIDMEAFLLKARTALHNKQSLPWKYNDFFLRDMADADGPGLAQLLPEKRPVRQLFLPGCQLGSSAPEYVLSAYAWLREAEPATALSTHCCGAPALWAGDGELHQEVLKELKDWWQELGRPRLVFACGTCKKMIDRYVPEMEGTFLYELLARQGAGLKMDMGREPYSVFDPCSCRHVTEVQAAVRTLAERGCTLTPLSKDGGDGGCCGYGGHTAVANPECTKGLTREQAGRSGSSYITYCSNCRDLFAAEGKKALHILDAVFDLNGPHRRPPDISERRRNRTELKRRLLEEYGGEGLHAVEKKEEMLLEISPELRKKLNDEWILEDCVAEVVRRCEETGSNLYDEENDVFIGHLQIGFVTYWAYYRKTEGGFTLVNAYCHRVKIETEGEL
ncbi:MAG: FAD-dependent oxidoreductase [Bacillota bacterium]|nr:FAD-dependent oxidoreductase [Bacillota bacterium]